MSRAFIKESDGTEVFEDLPDRAISPYPNYVTSEGLAKIEDQLSRLHSEYALAQKTNNRASLARISRDLRYWISRRSNAQLFKPSNDTSYVHFGSTVTIARDDDRRQTFRIVGEDEADPKQGTLSHISPLGSALIGKRLGDIVHIGPNHAQIIEIAP
jgi:transcription elongation GreA/GreB family factor